MPNQIVIRAPSGQLTRGETIVAPIVLTLEKRLKVRGIHARFWGAEETKATYTTTSTDSKGHTTTHTHTAVEHVNVVDEKRVLAGNEPPGCIGGLMDSLATLVGGGKNVVMDPGEYPFEFAFTVPQDAPATHAGKNTRIFYELSAWVDIPLAVDLKAKHSFDLPSAPEPETEPQAARVRYPGDAGRGFWDSIVSPDVRVELAVASDVARPGDTVEGIIVVESDKPLTIKALRASFVGTEHSQAQSHHEQAHFAGKPVEMEVPGSTVGGFSQTFSIPYELAGPPTLRGSKFHIDWFVQVELDVPWSKNPKIRVPIRLLRG